ncbi:hypothetical protein ABH989_006184 [Bradyrhizobium ottawaense]|uniref:hypothetical protein n=1 Tax=Bradyrhizobium ottawaense TaxID=931866 RepID=UPI00351881AD
MPPSITVAVVAAMIAAALEEERATVLTELADHLAEKFHQEREQRDALIDQVKTLTVAFQNLTDAFNRLDGASTRVIDLPSMNLRAH